MAFNNSSYHKKPMTAMTAMPADPSRVGADASSRRISRREWEVKVKKTEACAADVMRCRKIARDLQLRIVILL